MGRVESLHRARSPSGGLVRILSPIVQVLGLPMLDLREEFSQRRGVTAQLVGHDHTWHTARLAEYVPKEGERGLRISAGMDQNPQDETVPIDSTPGVMGPSIHLEVYLIAVPAIRRRRSKAPKAVGEEGSEFVAPCADRLVGHLDAVLRHQLRDVP
jgi:hypothetical protein